MATISRALRRIKQDLEPFLPEAMIREACRQVGHCWRERQFDPVTTLHLFIQQILNSNTAITHLRLLAKVPVNAASYCKAGQGFALVRGCACRCRSCRGCCGTRPRRWLEVKARRGCGTNCGSG